MKSALLVLIFALPSLAFAAPPSVVITDAGYFVLTADADGSPRTERALSVVDLRSPAVTPAPAPQPPAPEPAPAPVPPAKPQEPPAKPSPDEGLSQKAQAWAAEENDPAGAAAIATIYRQVGEAVQRGEVSPDEAAGVTRAAAVSTLSGWETFRSRVGAEAAERIATAGPMSASKMADFLLAIAHGIARGAPPLTLQRAVEITDAVNTAIGKK